MKGLQWLLPLKSRMAWGAASVLIVAVGLGTFLLFKPSSAAIATLIPISTNSNAWSASSTGCTTNTTGHTCIDEGASANTADFIGTGENMTATTALADFRMSTQTNVQTATQLTLHMHAWSVAAQRGFDSVTMGLNVNGSVLATSEITMTGTGTWYTVTYNGSWSQTDVNNIRATFTRNVIGSGGQASTRDDDVRIASAYVTMTYESPATVSQSAYRWLQQNVTQGANGAVAYNRSSSTNAPYTSLTMAADFNGDGALDIAGYSDYFADDMLVSLNNGQGVFPLPTTYTAGNGPIAAKHADVDGDGDIDIAVIHYIENTVSIYINNGNGTFAARVNYTTGTYPTDLDIADFDGDGDKDITVSNRDNNTISVLLNNGNGTYATKVDYATNLAPENVVVGNFNGDQFMDIAAVNKGSDNLSIFINNGNGTFATKVDYSTNDAPIEIVVADFNDDQIQDVAYINESSPYSLSIRQGAGNGTFGNAATYPLAEIANSQLIATDMNNDQKVDIVYASETSKTIHVRLNDGNGLFTKINEYANPASTATDILSLVVGDFNNDQAIDVGLSGMAASSGSLEMYDGITGPMFAPLANTNASATVTQRNAPVHLRVNLSVAGGNLTNSVSHKLRYAAKSAGTCSSNPSNYADVTASSQIKFYNDETLSDDALLTGSAYDPLRDNVPARGQKYKESNPFSPVATILANKDGLWDFSLAVDPAAAVGSYCLMVTKTDNTALDGYVVIPELAVVNPQLEQSNYRIFNNANSTTPGSPLAAQNTAANVTPGAPFRLRQLIRQTTESTSAGSSFILQAGEKATTCSAATYQTLTGPVQSSAGSTGRSFTASTITGYTSPDNAQTDNGVGAFYTFPYIEKNAVRTYQSFAAILKAENFGFSIPENAVINGIEYHLDVLSGTNVTDNRIFLAKTGTTIAGTDLAFNNPLTSRTYGSSSNLWGTTWTPAEINNPEFGLVFHAGIIDTGTLPSVSIDSLSVNVHYSILSSNGNFNDNTAVTDNALITISANDPIPTSGVVRPQTYNENQFFVNTVGIGQGENGLWDYSLKFDENVAGKTYCFRVVKEDGSLLTTYAQYPEVTFVAAPTGPSLSQQLRGGQAVIGGQKTPFNW